MLSITDADKPSFGGVLLVIPQMLHKNMISIASNHPGARNRPVVDIPLADTGKGLQHSLITALIEFPMTEDHPYKFIDKLKHMVLPPYAPVNTERFIDRMRNNIKERVLSCHEADQVYRLEECGKSALRIYSEDCSLPGGFGLIVEVIEAENSLMFTSYINGNQMSESVIFPIYQGKRQPSQLMGKVINHQSNLDISHVSIANPPVDDNQIYQAMGRLANSGSEALRTLANILSDSDQVVDECASNEGSLVSQLTDFVNSLKNDEFGLLADGFNDSTLTILMTKRGLYTEFLTMTEYPDYVRFDLHTTEYNNEVCISMEISPNKGTVGVFIDADNYTRKGVCNLAGDKWGWSISDILSYVVGCYSALAYSYSVADLEYFSDVANIKTASAYCGLHHLVAKK